MDADVTDNLAWLPRRTNSSGLCVARIMGVADRARLGSCRQRRRSVCGRCPESSGGRLRRPGRLGRVASRRIALSRNPEGPEPPGANSRSRCFAAAPDSIAATRWMEVDAGRPVGVECEFRYQIPKMLPCQSKGWEEWPDALRSWGTDVLLTTEPPPVSAFPTTWQPLGLPCAGLAKPLPAPIGPALPTSTSSSPAPYRDASTWWTSPSRTPFRGFATSSSGCPAPAQGSLGAYASGPSRRLRALVDSSFGASRHGAGSRQSGGASKARRDDARLRQRRRAITLDAHRGVLYRANTTRPRHPKVWNNDATVEIPHFVQ